MCSRRSASLVSSVGTATIVRSDCGTPAVSSRPGKVIAPELQVIARSTSAVATSVAGRNEIKANSASQRSEEHTSELQSLMRISYAVFCLKKKKRHQQAKRPQHQAPHTQKTLPPHDHFELKHNNTSFI